MVYSIAVMLVASVLLGGVYPGIVQKFRVQPNEIVMEKPYLERRLSSPEWLISLTPLKRKTFRPEECLMQKISGTPGYNRKHQALGLGASSANLQPASGNAPYYQFVDIDVDRYVVDGNYRQVMLAARELNQEHLQPQAKT